MSMRFCAIYCIHENLIDKKLQKMHSVQLGFNCAMYKKIKNGHTGTDTTI